MSDKVFFRKTGLLALSLLLSIVTWLFIQGEVERSVTGPLAYKDVREVEVRLMGEPLSLGKSFYVVELENRSVDVRIKGPEQELERLTKLDITAFVDVSGLKPGRSYSPVVKFILPPGIELVGAAPLVRVEIKDKNI